MKLARLSYLTHRPLCPRQISLVLISVSVWVDPRRINSMKNPTTWTHRTSDPPFCSALPQRTPYRVCKESNSKCRAVCLNARSDFTISTSSQYDQYYATGWYSKAIILIFNNNMADARNFEGEWHRRHLFQDPDVCGNRSLREKWVSLGWCCWRENWVFIYASSAVGLEAGTNESFSWLFNKLYR